MYELNGKIKDLEPYEPLKGEYQIRLDANESFLALPDSLQKKAFEAMKALALNRYPDPAAADLCAAFAQRYRVPVENVAAGNGSDELISVVFQSFLEKGDAYSVIAPDFSMYKFYGYISECTCVEIEKGENWQIDLDKVIETCNNKNVKLLVFSNPCNPTGIGLDRAAVRRLVTSVSALVVLDEAYMDFWNESMLGEFQNYDNLLILKTCSKAFGLAAIRVGFAVGQEKLIRAIKAVKSPYNVNSLSQKLVETVLLANEECDAAFQTLIAAKDALQTELKALEARFPDKLEVCDSVTNFVVVKTPSAGELFRFLLDRSIAVRYFANMSALRITAGSPEENAAVLREMTAFFEGK